MTECMNRPVGLKRSGIDRSRCKNEVVNLCAMEERVYASAECMFGQTDKSDTASE